MCIHSMFPMLGNFPFVSPRSSIHYGRGAQEEVDSLYCKGIALKERFDAFNLVMPRLEDVSRR